MTTGAALYANAEAANASRLQSVAQEARSLVTVLTGATGAHAAPKSGAAGHNGSAASASGTGLRAEGVLGRAGLSATGGGGGQVRTSAAALNANGTTTSTATSASTAIAASGVASSAGAGGTGLGATYTVSSQWANGFTADYTITNNGSTPLTNWQAQFNLPANESITNAWNAQMVHSGTQYTLTPESYNTTIAPGHSVTLGFQASQTGSYSPPTHLLVGGHSIGTGTGTGTGSTGTGSGTGGTGTGGTGTGGTGTGTGSTLITTQYGKTTIENSYLVQNNAYNNPQRAVHRRLLHGVHHHRGERLRPHQRRPAGLSVDLSRHGLRRQLAGHPPALAVERDPNRHQQHQLHLPHPRGLRRVL